MTRDRDSQRAKVFRALDRVQTEDAGANLKQIRKWVISRLRLNAITNRYPTGPYALSRCLYNESIEILPGRPMTIPWVYTKLSKDTYVKHRVLQHMAYHIHGICTYIRTSTTAVIPINAPDAAYHSWQYCQIYMDLVRYCVGKEAADQVKAAFKAEGVKWKTPRKLTKPTEQQMAGLTAHNRKRDAHLVDGRWESYKQTGRKRVLDL